MKILQFAEHYQLIFDNAMSTTTNKLNRKWRTFFCKLLRIKFFFLILLREVTLESKAVPTNHKNPAFHLHTGKPIPTLSCLPFLINYFETNFRHQNKNNVDETLSCFNTNCQKNIAYIMCLNT